MTRPLEISTLSIRPLEASAGGEGELWITLAEPATHLGQLVTLTSSEPHLAALAPAVHFAEGVQSRRVPVTFGAPPPGAYTSVVLTARLLLGRTVDDPVVHTCTASVGVSPESRPGALPG